MAATYDDVLALADAFQTAALNGDGWYGALDRLAQATGSQTGELIGVGSNAAVPFNIMTNMDPGFHPAFVAAGGGDPTVNPRVGAGMTAPVLKVMSEEDFISPNEYKRNAHYQEFAIPWGVPHICLSTLERQNGMLIGLAVVRSRRNGPITPEQKALYAAVAPHVRAAVRTQIALENQGAQLLQRAFGALHMAAFVCDRFGTVRAMTQKAEDLVAKGDVLHLRCGRLAARREDNAQVLSSALDEAALGIVHPGRPLMRTVVLRGGDSAPATVIDVIRLPGLAHEFTFTPRALLVVRGKRHSDPDSKAALVQVAYELTAAEADIALRLTQGQTPEEIAADRKVSIGTIRAQLKTVMAKLGVRRQAELVSSLHWV